jgi:riboflavin kinase/FMN adenylyltransferase
MTPAIVTIGNFDGVHRGHRKLIRQVVERARALNLRSFAITFDPHPEQVLFPESKLTYLSTAEERQAILQQCGIDSVWICPFTIALARMEPEDFMHMVSERQPLAELWVGSDFALGRGRRGTTAVLADIGSHSGWAVHMLPPQMFEGQVVSSTAIRTLISTGAVRGAADLLGRNYTVRGEIEGSELVVDPQRTLPRGGMSFEAQLRQNEATHDLSVTTLPAPGHINFDSPIPKSQGAADLTFLRRKD